MADDFATAARLDVVRYSQVWEDHLTLETGLEVGPDDDVLVIGSAGCNALALLLAEPRSVVAVDLSEAQVALMELKVAGIRHLGYEDFVRMLGLSPGGDPVAIYAGLRDRLGERTRAFWDEREEALRDGLVGCGMLERYFRAFQERHLSRLVDAEAVRRLLALEDAGRQRELWESEIGSPELEAAVREFFSPEAMSGRARDASQFRYVEQDDVAGFFWRRLEHACTAMPARGNFYLEWFLTSGYADLEAGPPFARREGFARLRSLVDRLEIVEDDLGRFLDSRPPGSFSKAGLSDMLEYLPEEAAGAMLEKVASRLRPGGRIAYWNLLVPRSRPDWLADRLTPLRERSRALWQRDRAFIYGDFHLDEVAATG